MNRWINVTRRYAFVAGILLALVAMLIPTGFSGADAQSGRSAYSTLR